MDISIIIVNYNVKYFLEQCLHSISKGIGGLAIEVFVVDNASSDGSTSYLQPMFPWVHFVQSESNLGFAKANNLVLAQCTGNYILFLNPDTILPEDCLSQCFAFMQKHTEAGALGIRMVDGSGTFLPESKRSFPSPLISFYKLVGLSSLFPRSKIFGRYALGYLDEHKNHQVDVLAGAFMMLRKELVMQLNGFDETFFMYGEDVDLSFRVQQAGYVNYYYSGSSIVHFKGESTRKGSLNYLKMFYQAMSIFVRKHYSGSKARIFSFFIHVAILLRAALSAVVNLVTRIGMPLFDALIIFGSFYLVNQLWINYVRGGDAFLPQLVNISLPGFTLVFVVAATLAGIYDNQYKPSKAFYAALLATIVMLAVYSLLPEKYRFSRGVILFGGLTAVVFITLFRWLLQKWGVVEENDEEVNKEEQTLVVGTPSEFNEIAGLLHKAGISSRIMGRVGVNGHKEDSVATLEQLAEVSRNLGVREIIFVQGYLSYKKIIDVIQELPGGICVRFHAAGSQSIVGSDSKDTSGEFVSVDGHFQLTHPYQKRMKRLLDVGVAVFILLTLPLQVFICGKRCIPNAARVLVGKKTWVGYSRPWPGLPALPPGILDSGGHPVLQNSPAGNTHPIDSWYARHYHWQNDLKIIIRHYRRLGF